MPLTLKIVFTSTRAGEGVEIYTMNSDGSKPDTDNLSPQGCHFSYVFLFEDYTKGEIDNNFWVMDADGKNLRQLTFQPEWRGYPDWSPDGFQIAFDSDREEQEGGPPQNSKFT